MHILVAHSFSRDLEDSSGLRPLPLEWRGIYLPIPGRPWTEANWLDNPRWLTRWLGLHLLVMATKP